MCASKRKADVAIIVALPEEFEHLYSTISARAEHVRRPQRGGYDYQYSVETPRGFSYNCVASLIGGMGPDLATRHTDYLITTWEPASICVVGIAAGIHGDLRLGDVVVADQVDAYLATTKAVPGDNGDSFVLEHRGRSYSFGHEVIENVRHLQFVWQNSFKKWRTGCRERLRKLFLETRFSPELAEIVGTDGRDQKLHVGHVASGPVVGAAEAFSGWLRARDTGILALEMEAAGVAASVHGHDRVKTLVLRGISDFGDARKGRLDAHGQGAFRALAMQNAIEFLQIVLETGTLGAPRGTNERKLMASRAEMRGRLASWLLSPVDRHKQIRGLKVLLVDDDRDTVEVIAALLGTMDIEVLEAVDCEKALSVTKTESIDVLVTDVVMPSMSGVELALAIRTRQPSTPVLFCTGQIANFIPPLENSAVIKKPLLMSELQNQLASLVGDTEWNDLLMAWPELGKVYHALVVCKKIVKQLNLGGDGGDLVEVALRHKARDSVNAFCDELASGVGVEVSVERLRIQLSKLSALVRAVRNSERLGLPGYLLGAQADLRATYRNLRLNIDMDESVRSDLPQEIEAPLILCAVELIDNAREALAGKGEIRVAVRKWITTEAVSISVSSDTGPLMDDVAAHLFEEGFSTKGSDRGLGLSLVKQFAQRLGGDVELVCDLASVEFILTVPTNVIAEHSTNTIRRMRPGQ